MNTNRNCPELLAPAGDFERLTAAVLYGADAVYLGGGMFGMRAAQAHFKGERLRQAVEYAHLHGVKVYLTCNTVPTNEEADLLEDFLLQAKEAGVDALIIADIGVLQFAHRLVPKLPIHISTQTGIMNYLTATELYRLGASRVVLARELSLEQISVLRKKTPPELELEAFVHGAMCMSVSGRCLLSQYLTHRDANRGECTQPCRWSYYLMEEKRPGEFFPVFEDEKGSYILNAQDMCMIEYLDQLKEAGIDSFKIEGRAKSAYYVSVVTNAYRIACDLLKQNPKQYHLPDWVLEEVRKVSHRRYSTGFYFGTPGQYYEDGGYVRSMDVAAIVDGYEDGCMSVTERNRFSVSDSLELLQPGLPPVEFTLKEMTDEQGNEITTANHAMMTVKIPFPSPVKAGSILRKWKNEN